MAQFLFEVEEKNRLRQTGLLKRFTMNCYGKQETLETIRALKTEMYKKLADQRGTREYDMWFLKYSPALNKDKAQKNEKQNKTHKKRVKSKYRASTSKFSKLLRKSFSKFS
jgi:hypothetical protein